MTDTSATQTIPRPARLLVGLLTLLLAAALGWALWHLPGTAVGLAPEVSARLADSGVRNPVTAVLLNFRGYDTWLELAVLLLAVLGSWTLAHTTDVGPVEPVPGLLLSALLRLLLPLMVLVAGYLLWIGATAPGGAFQAGSVLAAAGVLILLAWPAAAERLPDSLLRGGLSLGLAGFFAVALGSLARTGYLLQYPTGWAGRLILLIEAAATLSIGLTLTALFVGGRPRRTERESSP